MKQIWKQNINKSLDNNSKYIQNVLMNLKLIVNLFLSLQLFIDIHLLFICTFKVRKNCELTVRKL